MAAADDTSRQEDPAGERLALALDALQDLLGILERRLGPAANNLAPVVAAREIIAKAEGR